MSTRYSVACALSAFLVFASSHFSACTSSDAEALTKERNDIDSLIRSEPKLSVQPTDDVITGKSTETVDNDQGHGVSTTEKHKMTTAFEKMVAFDPNVASLYPGALVQGKGLLDGILIPVETQRTPLVITISDFYQKGSLSLSRRVQQPSLANINDTIQNILKQETNTAMPADVSFTQQEVYSLDQAFLKLNASYKWATGAINGAFSSGNQEKATKFLVRFVEKYFTVSCAPPTSPSSYILRTNDTSLKHYLLKDKKDSIPNPLCYVSSVSYGRELWLLIESSEKASDLEAALNVSFGGLNAGGSVSFSDAQKKIINESSIQAYIIGGARGKALELLTGDKIAKLGDFLKEKDQFVQSDPPRPIAYTVAYLSDNSPARVSSTTDYTIKTNDITVTSPLISAVVHFDNGDDGKDQSTGLRVYLFDKRTLGANYIASLNKANPDIAPVAYADLYDNTEQGVDFKDNSSYDMPLGLRQPTNSEQLQDGVLFVWMFPHGHDRWQFTPTIHLKFKDSRLNKDVQLGAADLNQNNGYIAIPFSLH